MNLFSDITRIDTSPKKNIEPDYDYLDRSARPEAGKVRDFLEHWFANYPQKEKKELKRRIISGNPHNYSSATFELLLYAICSQLGYSIQIHPKIPYTTSKPDFLLTDSLGNNLYLEAANVSDTNENGQAEESRKDRLLDTINKLENNEFYLGIKTKGYFDTPPNGRKIRNKLKRWLSTIDPDTVILNFSKNGRDSLPTFEWEDEKWKITFIAFPKSPETRSKSDRIIGMIMPEIQRCEIWEPMRNTILSKGKNYGKLNRPLIIALNVQSPFVDRIDEMQALFGEETYIFDINNHTTEPVFQRRPNGVWHGKHGYKYKRISGVWFFHSINPWNIALKGSTIYLNPKAEKPFNGNLLELPYVMEEKHKMPLHEGRSIREILELDPMWPE